MIIRGSGVLQEAGNHPPPHPERRQPRGEDSAQRRIASIDWIDSDKGRALQVITTSQKLAHRIVHELNKLFRAGVATYSWRDDGTLFATWEYELPKRKPKKAAEVMAKKSPPPKPKKRAPR